MGADILIMNWWTSRKPADIDWDAGHVVIDTLDIDDLDPSGFEEYDEGDDELSTPVLDRLRKKAHQTLTEYAALWRQEDDRRDVAVYQMGPLAVMTSGGMSWGDDPTEGFRDMNDMPEKALEACGFFK